jgi:acetylornithine deacetylase
MNDRRLISETVEEMREEIIDFTRALVQIPSVNHPPGGDEGDCQRFITREWEAMGLDVDVFNPDDVEDIVSHPAYLEGRDYADRPNVVGKHLGRRAGRSLLLISHVDVVPPGPLEQWWVSPWSGVVKDGKVYGRGSSDDKAGIAIQTMALQAVLRAGFRLNGNVYLASAVDEEYGGANGTLACVLRGYEADGGVMIDGTAGEIQIANLGGSRFKVEVECETQSHHHLDINATVHCLANVCRTLLEWGDVRQEKLKSHPLYKDTTYAAAGINIMSCTAGSQEGTLAAPKAGISGFFYTLPQERKEEIARSFEDCVRQVSELGECQVHINWLGRFRNGGEIDPKEPIVLIVQDNHQRIMGYPAPITGFGGCDLFILNNYSHTPTVMIGAQSWGRSEGPHQPNESVSIDEGLIPLTKIVALTMMQWCGYTRPDQGP